jgi:hypothetical protein
MNLEFKSQNESSLLGIVIVLALNRLAGQSLGSLYIRRGNLRLGMQKSNSIWGSMLFHAAMDTPVFVGIFSNLA